MLCMKNNLVCSSLSALTDAAGDAWRARDDIVVVGHFLLLLGLLQQFQLLRVLAGCPHSLLWGDIKGLGEEER